MFFDSNNDVVHAIQLAVTPVFLLTGIAGLLNVLVNRMGRIIDRYRVLEHAKGSPKHLHNLQSILNEQMLLDRRAKLIHWAIGLCTASALFICAVNIFLFLDSIFGLSIGVLISVIFILSSLVLFFGLVCFLNEVRIATRSIYSVTPIHK